MISGTRISMDNFTAHRLRFVTEAQSIIELNEHQGSAIRGSLFHALRNRFCGNKRADECANCPLVATCPVATLVSTFRGWFRSPTFPSLIGRFASRRVGESASRRVGESRYDF